MVEATTNGLPIVAVRTAEQREHYKTALSDRDVRFTVDDLEFEGPLAGVLGAIDAIDDPVHMRVRQPLLLAAAIAWLADQSRRRDGAVHSVQRRNANNHDVFAIKQLNRETTGLRVFDRHLAVDQAHDALPATAVCGRYSTNSTTSRSSPRKRRCERSGTQIADEREHE